MSVPNAINGTNDQNGSNVLCIASSIKYRELVQSASISEVRAPGFCKAYDYARAFRPRALCSRRCIVMARPDPRKKIFQRTARLLPKPNYLLIFLIIPGNKPAEINAIGNPITRGVRTIPDNAIIVRNLRFLNKIPHQSTTHIVYFE